MGGETGKVGWVLFLRDLEYQATEFVFILGGNGEPLRTLEQESGSIGDLEFQENPQELEGHEQSPRERGGG